MSDRKEHSPVSLDVVTPEQLSVGFSAADLPGQFVLTRSDEAVPSGWPVRCHQSWTLSAHPRLPVVTMRALDGTDVGWLLGHPINESAEFLRDIVALPFDRHASPDEMESWLSRLCGRFLAIWLTPIYERVYPDAGALLAAVFAPEHGLVASTTSLVPYSRGCVDDVELLLHSRGVGGRAVLGFGLTSRHGVHRLQPNHYLDLARWQMIRHWPVSPLDEPCDPVEAIQIVSKMIRRHVVAGMRRGNVVMALTAGMDSRSVLACSREFAEQIELMTLAIPDRSGRIDVDVATRIAARHGLSHRVVPQSPPSQDEIEGWRWRTGSCLSLPRAWRAANTHSPAGSRVEITGAGGEAARVAYWRDAGAGKHPLTPEVLVSCLRIPATKTVVEHARAWMESYPASTPIQILDGFDIENALGVTAGAVAYGDATDVQCRLHPLVNRAALDAMLRLSEAYKRERRFPLDLINCHWPELLQVPFNRRTGVRHVIDRARRRAWLMRHPLAGTGTDG